MVLAKGSNTLIFDTALAPDLSATADNGSIRIDKEGCLSVRRDSPTTGRWGCSDGLLVALPSPQSTITLRFFAPAGTGDWFGATWGPRQP